MPEYVAYTNGLLADEDKPGVDPGTTVKANDFTPEDWDYHIAHGNIVRKGGPNDPNVLAEQAEVVADEKLSPEQARIRELEDQLSMYTGRQPTPAPGTHLSDLADAQAAEDQEESTNKPAPRVAATPVQK
jgi:hypothetical protein